MEFDPCYRSFDGCHHSWSVSSKMTALYEMPHPDAMASILEDMRKKCANEFGVTLTGNRLTLRWNHKNFLPSVHMIIESVYTEADEKEQAQMTLLVDLAHEIDKDFTDAADWKDAMPRLKALARRALQ